MILTGPCSKCKKLCQIQLGQFISADRVQVINAQNGQPMVFDIETYAHQILTSKGDITCGSCNALANYGTA